MHTPKNRSQTVRLPKRTIAAIKNLRQTSFEPYYSVIERLILEHGSTTKDAKVISPAENILLGGAGFAAHGATATTPQGQTKKTVKK